MKLYFDPEYIPDAAERGSLTSLTKMPGYGVLHKVLKGVVDRYLVELREANTADTVQCMDRIRRSQVSADMYQTFVDSINLYVQVVALDAEGADENFNPDATSELDMDFESDLENLTSYFDFEENQV